MSWRFASAAKLPCQSAFCPAARVIVQTGVFVQSLRKGRGEKRREDGLMGGLRSQAYAALRPGLEDLGPLGLQRSPGASAPDLFRKSVGGTKSPRDGLSRELSARRQVGVIEAIHHSRNDANDCAATPSEEHQEFPAQAVEMKPHHRVN